jgi:tRNA-splicing ligase RtcB (3'-phosphate/5'-hydroxy nucleic acid ligase)
VEQLAANGRVMSWASMIEPQALEQVLRISRLPLIYPHVAVMPDVHWGKGASVGTVIPTKGAIIPAAVGVDIGCGMMAVRTQFSALDIHTHQDRDGQARSELREAIEKAIPSSAGRYNDHITQSARDRIEELSEMRGADSADQVVPFWADQLGSLGSGNHFIEICLDEQDRVWLFLHSGSRGVGNKLAMKHIKVAQNLCRKYHVKLEDPDLAYLTADRAEFWQYIEDLKWAQHFALLNREEMMMRLAGCLSEWMNRETSFEEVISCHHNYTEEMPSILLGMFRDNPAHDPGSTVWLSRKGAIDADAGKLGLIPGSMGAASYVVEGKGDKMSLWSSPHGAGRLMSRGQAKRELTFESLEKAMGNREWKHSAAFLDEHPDAYKPIDQVMKDAEPLVSVKHELHQILNVKGV